MAMKRVVGKVTKEECKEIQSLFERRNGLRELVQIIDPNNKDLYEKLVTDMGSTSTKFQAWWDRMASKYHWESTEDSKWEVNFDTCEINLVTE